MASNQNDSVTQDSDTVYEMFCEECDKYDKSYVPAESFCVDCVEYKCKDCLRYHKRHNKTHMIQDKYSMPQDFYTEKCTSHPKQIIKYYCNDCEAQACQECKENDHQRCGQVKHLPTLVNGIQHSKKLKDLKETMEKVSKDIEVTDKLILCKSEMIEKQESEAKETCRKYKYDLIDRYKQHLKEKIDDFDEFKLKMEEIIVRLNEERKQLVKKLSKKETTFEEKVSKAEKDIERSVESSNTDYKRIKTEYDTLVKDFKTMSTDLIKAEELDQKCKLFLNIKITEKLSNELRKNIEKLNSNEENFIKVKQTLKSNTSIEILENFETFFSLEKIPKSAKIRTATFDSEICFKFERFSNLCIFTNSTLLAIDHKTCFLGILKTSRTNIDLIYEKQLPYNPWAIARISYNKFAVTFPKPGKIIMVTVSDSKKVEYTYEIKVRGGCYGIAYSQDHLLVSFTNPGSVNILDMSGTVLTSLNTDSTGTPIFAEPLNIALSQDKTTMYISDISMNTVTSMTYDGKVKAIYKDDFLKEPCQMTVDEFGSVYVCGRLSHNIHQLSCDLVKVNVLLDESQAINQPVSVAYNEQTRKLYVGIFNSNIKIFNLSTR